MYHRQDTIEAVAGELEQMSLSREDYESCAKMAETLLHNLHHKGVIVVDLPRKAIDYLNRLNGTGLWGVLFEDTINEVILNQLRRIVEAWGE